MRDLIIKTPMNQKEKEKLIKKSKAAGMKPTEYIRKLVEESEVYIWDVQLVDFSELAATLNEFNKNFDTFLGIMKATNNVYPQQMDEVINMLKRLEDDWNGRIKKEMDWRYDHSEIYSSMVKKEIKKIIKRREKKL